MKFTKRHLFGSVASLSSLALLAACATGNPLQTTVTVNLANVQLEAKAIYSALSGFIAGATTVAPPAMAAKIAGAYDALGKAVEQLTGISNGSTQVGTLTMEVLAAITALLPLIPGGILPAATLTAIQLGVSLISALVGGLSSITVPPAALTPKVGAVATISAPIPIPM